MKSILVVGASLAGLHAAEALRREGFDGAVTMIGAEEHLPYDRPPLSKQFLAGEATAASLRLRSESELSAQGLDVLPGRRATGLDAANRAVQLDDGTDLPYDGLVIATGASPRTIPGSEELAGVFVIRTLDDAVALREALEAASEVVVVGGGFIGAETAATCSKAGKQVTIIEVLEQPMIQALGEEIGSILARLHTDHGVRIRCRSRVRRLLGTCRVTGVELGDGTIVPADVVVVGIGVTPNTQWLAGSGLALEDGVVCDSRCRAAPGIVAAGDVARWHNEFVDARMRLEHWENAVDQGEAAAIALLRGDQANPFIPVPYVWSDQYDCRIQIVGGRLGADRLDIAYGSADTYRFTGVYSRNGRPIGAVAVNRPRLANVCRAAIASRLSLDELYEATPALRGPDVMTRLSAQF
jgi:3-phenylpropionate/trans-cinnamate dioxygenase ferredoxin reductase subunit